MALAGAGLPGEVAVSFGFLEDGPPSEIASPRSAAGTTGGSGGLLASSGGGWRKSRKQQFAGLGQGHGGQLARGCLVSVGSTMMEQARAKRIAADFDGLGQSFAEKQPAPPGLRSEALPLRAGDGGVPYRRAAATPKPRFSAASAPEEGEPEGLFMGLLLNDGTAASPALLRRIEDHRWTFKDAAVFASHSRASSFLVWCLLELQRNVQMEAEEDALDPGLVGACRAFVGSESRRGRMADMYNIFSHFISNSVVFHEWDKFLRVSFEDPKANQEAFLVPRLEQVWLRFKRLHAILEGIFGDLNTRFAWKHRLPQVGDLVLEHMRRRCFSSELIARNEVFQQAIIKDETLKQVKLAFGFN